MLPPVPPVLVLERLAPVLVLEGLELLRFAPVAVLVLLPVVVLVEKVLVVVLEGLEVYIWRGW